MTRNAYGVEAEIDLDAFNDWEWQVYTPTSLVDAISTDAAKTVLGVIAGEAHLALYSTEDGCEVRLSLGADMGNLSISFAKLIDDWITQESGDEEARVPLIAALEDAIAKLEDALAKVRAAA